MNFEKGDEMTKEEIYDEQISPLMAQVIEICRKYKIANICTFALPCEENDELACTTAMLSEEFDPPESYLKALDQIRPPQMSSLMTIRDDDGNVKEMHAIVGR